MTDNNPTPEEVALALYKIYGLKFEVWYGDKKSNGLQSDFIYRASFDTIPDQLVKAGQDHLNSGVWRDQPNLDGTIRTAESEAINIVTHVLINSPPIEGIAARYHVECADGAMRGYIDLLGASEKKNLMPVNGSAVVEFSKILDAKRDYIPPFRGIGMKSDLDAEVTQPLNHVNVEAEVSQDDVSNALGNITGIYQRFKLIKHDMDGKKWEGYVTEIPHCIISKFAKEKGLSNSADVVNAMLKGSPLGSYNVNLHLKSDPEPVYEFSIQTGGNALCSDKPCCRPDIIIKFAEFLGAAYEPPILRTVSNLIVTSVNNLAQNTISDRVGCLTQSVNIP